MSPRSTMEELRSSQENNIGVATEFLPSWARLRTPPSMLMPYFGHDPSSSDKVIDYSDEAGDIIHADTLLGAFSGESLNEIK